MPDRGGLRILLVDDGRGLIETIIPAVAAMRYEIHVTDPATALTADPPDVVVLGLDPTDPGGEELIQEFRQQSVWRKPFILGVTNTDDPNDTARAIKAGAHLVLVTPIDPTLLAGVFCRFRDFMEGVENCEPAGEPPHRGA